MNTKMSAKGGSASGGKNKKRSIINIPAIGIVVFAFFSLSANAKTESGSSYWKTYFSQTEKIAVQKIAEKYTLAEIKKKNEDWKNVFTGFNIKNGSISSDDIDSIDTGKIKNLDDRITEKTSGKLSTSGGTLSGLLTWASGQTFNAGDLTGTYAALNGSLITGITASQVGAVPYSGATTNVNLNEKNLINLGKIGIGTMNPTHNLEILGSSGSYGEISLKDSDGRLGYIIRQTSDLNSDSSYNDILQIGSNVSPGGGLSEAGSRSVYMQFERSWLSENRPVSEWHVDFIRSNGTTLRTLQSNIDDNSGDGALTFQNTVVAQNSFTDQDYSTAEGGINGSAWGDFK